MQSIWEIRDKNGRFSHVLYDLRFSPAGIRRWVVRHCFYRYHCRNCAHGYNELPHQEKFGQGLKAYVLYQIIELRVSQHAVARSLATLFGLQISRSTINRIKASAAIAGDLRLQHAGPHAHVIGFDCRRLRFAPSLYLGRVTRFRS